MPDGSFAVYTLTMGGDGNLVLSAKVTPPLPAAKGACVVRVILVIWGPLRLGLCGWAYVADSFFRWGAGLRS